MRRANRSDEHGFTLVELLVVILILTILAAIAIPSFASRRGLAQDAVAKTLVREAHVTLETLHMAKGSYDVTVPELLALEPTLVEAIGLSVSGDPTTFTLAADSQTGHRFTIARRPSGVLVRTCAPAGAGGCPDSGFW